MESSTITHTLQPIFNSESRVLILGTIPSPKSRKIGFYYGNPQNRFWKLLAAVFHETVPSSNADKTQFLLQHKIAMWDVLAQCSIVGAKDSSIRNAIPNDIGRILSQTAINTIFTTGKTAYSFYHKLLEPSLGISALLLPSPSPANCAIPMETMLREYCKIAEHL